MNFLIKPGTLIAGVLLIGIAVSADHINSKIKIPSPSFTDEELQWYGSRLFDQRNVVTGEKLMKQHMQHASMYEKPEFYLDI